MKTPKKFETVSINGKQIFYEVYGQGAPLLFLHGYGMSSRSWEEYVSDFTDVYEVYLIDLPGHGQSECFRENFSLDLMAQDLDALIQYLGLKRLQAIGFSLGGDLLFQLALINPPLIKSMIVIGSVGTWNVNDFPQLKATFTYENRDNFSWLVEAQRSEDHVKALLDEFKNYIIYLSNEEIQQIQSEVMVVVGDGDGGISLEEVARVRRYLNKSDIWVLPNVTHGAHEGGNKDEFIIKTRKFLLKSQSVAN